MLIYRMLQPHLMISVCIDCERSRGPSVKGREIVTSISKSYATVIFNEQVEQVTLKKICDESGIRTHALSDQIYWSSNDLILSLAP